MPPRPRGGKPPGKKLVGKRQGRGKPAGERLEKRKPPEVFSELYWLEQTLKLKKNPNFLWAFDVPLILSLEKSPKWRKVAKQRPIVEKVKEKLRLASKEGRGKDIRAIVTPFVYAGADDLIIRILRNVKLFSWAGHVYENRAKYFAAGGEYFKAGDIWNLRRMVGKLRKKLDEKMDEKKRTVIKENVKSLETHLKILKKRKRK